MLRQGEVADSLYILVPMSQIERAGGCGLSVLNRFGKGERFAVTVYTTCRSLLTLDLRQLVQRNRQRAYSIFLAGVPCLWRLRQNRGCSLATPIDTSALQALCIVPAPGLPRQADPVFGHQAPVLLLPRQRPVCRRIDEIGDNLLHQTRPFRGPSGVLIKQI